MYVTNNILLKKNLFYFLIQKAGCDNVLGSDAKYDNCYVCGGDNSTCRFVNRRFSVPMYYG